MSSDDSFDEKISALVDRLSCHDLDSHEVEGIVALCVQARRDPARTLAENYGTDAAKVAQYDPDGIIAFIVFTELEDYFAVSDTVDELHEQIVAAFEAPALPDYPYDDNNFETVTDYYAWLDGQLLAHHPKYRLIEFGQSYTHDFQAVLVLRDEAPQILALCEELGLHAQPCG